MDFRYFFLSSFFDTFPVISKTLEVLYSYNVKAHFNITIFWRVKNIKPISVLRNGHFLNVSDKSYINEFPKILEWDKHTRMFIPYLE